MRNHTTPSIYPEDLYHPIEHAILADYLQVVRPPCAKDINLDEEVEQSEETHDGIIRPRPSYNGSMEYYVLENAAARLALNGIEKRLPQWAVFYENGQATYGRIHNRKRQEQITLLPVFLFEINWADSGPGFSWPEQYHATYIPGYHQYVLSASADCPDVYGYEDIAIGHFPGDTPLKAGCRQGMIDWWRHHRGEDPDMRWQDFWVPGLIGESEAWAWSDEIWGSCDSLGDAL